MLSSVDNKDRLWKIDLLLSCLVLSLLLIGCGRSSELSVGNSRYPVVDPNPKHNVKIYGIITSSLTVDLFALYSSPDDQQGCKITVNWLEGVSLPVYVKIPLPLARSGDEYSTILVVDRFLPGPCRWRFDSVIAKVSKNGIESIANPIIHNAEKSIGRQPPQENWFYNSNDQPVTWHCAFSRLETLSPGMKSFACNPWKAKGGKYKHQHRLSNKNTSIRADFIDLEK